MPTKRNDQQIKPLKPTRRNDRERLNALNYLQLGYDLAGIELKGSVYRLYFGDSKLPNAVVDSKSGKVIAGDSAEIDNYLDDQFDENMPEDFGDAKAYYGMSTDESYDHLF